MSVPLVRTLVLYFAVICAVRLMGEPKLHCFHIVFF